MLYTWDSWGKTYHYPNLKEFATKASEMYIASHWTQRLQVGGREGRSKCVAATRLPAETWGAALG